NVPPVVFAPPSVYVSVFDPPPDGSIVKLCDGETTAPPAYARLVEIAGARSRSYGWLPPVKVLWKSVIAPSPVNFTWDVPVVNVALFVKIVPLVPESVMTEEFAVSVPEFWIVSVAEFSA